MKTHTVSEILSPAAVNISHDNILIGLGVPAGQVDSYLFDLISSLYEHTRKISSPRVSYSIFSDPKVIGNATLALEGLTFQVNRMIGVALEGVEEIAVFIGTCGDEIERYSKKLIEEGNLLEGLIVDLIGSETTEKVAEYVHRKLAFEMELKGWKTTNRFSPGYCNWPVDEQHKLFSLMPSNASGVSLTDSSLMIPIKSVSGIIGLGEGVIKKDYPCNVCDADFCLHRDRTSK